MNLFLDIETVRDTCTPEQREYREKNIKPHGGMKDPEKIAADIEKKKQELYNEDALIPIYGRIVCIGFFVEEKMDVPLCAMALEEKILLEQFFAMLHHFYDDPAGFCYPVTFNGNDFDIPFLNLRIMKHKLIDHYHFQRLNEMDLKNILAQKYVNFPEHTLEEYAMFFGLDYPEASGSGADVQKWWDNGDVKSIADHCVSDVKLVYELYKIAHLFPIGRRF